MTDLTTGQRIAQCRKELSLSQEALGEKLGVSRQAVSKWEADGVMPDIDKLIGLSKLFGVSVGWLLGVEELEPRTPEMPAEPQVSEELLRKIEQIVLRYRPQKQKLSTKKKIWLGLAVVLALWLGITWWNKWQTESGMLMFTYSRVDAINEQNAKIQNQLNALSERLEGLSSTMEQAAAALASYDFTLVPDLENQTVQVEVDIVPKTWAEGSTAFLSVRKDGEEVVSQACYWDGTALFGRVKLPTEDGFAYWLVVQTFDNKQESIPLVNEPAQSLHRSFNIVCSLHPEFFRYEEGILEFDMGNMYIYRPEPQVNPEQWYWKELFYNLYVYRDGELVGSSLTPVDPYRNNEQFIEMWGGHTAQFPVIDHAHEGTQNLQKGEYFVFENGDTVEFWASLSLENGVKHEQCHGKWVYEDGDFRPVE